MANRFVTGMCLTALTLAGCGEGLGLGRGGTSASEDGSVPAMTRGVLEKLLVTNSEGLRFDRAVRWQGKLYLLIGPDRILSVDLATGQSAEVFVARPTAEKLLDIAFDPSGRLLLLSLNSTSATTVLRAYDREGSEDSDFAPYTLASEDIRNSYETGTWAISSQRLGVDRTGKVFIVCGAEFKETTTTDTRDGTSILTTTTGLTALSIDTVKLTATTTKITSFTSLSGTTLDLQIKEYPPRAIVVASVNSDGTRNQGFRFPDQENATKGIGAAKPGIAILARTIYSSYRYSIEQVLPGAAGQLWIRGWRSSPILLCLNSETGDPISFPATKSAGVEEEEDAGLLAALEEDDSDFEFGSAESEGVAEADWKGLTISTTTLSSGAVSIWFGFNGNTVKARALSAAVDSGGNLCLAAVPDTPQPLDPMLVLVLNRDTRRISTTRALTHHAPGAATALDLEFVSEQRFVAGLLLGEVGAAIGMTREPLAVDREFGNGGGQVFGQADQIRLFSPSRDRLQVLTREPDSSGVNHLYVTKMGL